MADISLPSPEISYPVSDLVDSFLLAAQNVVAFSSSSDIELKPAEMVYELDQLVSDYLDTHELSASHFDSIQQHVIDSVADHLSQCPSVHCDIDGAGTYSEPDLVTVLSHLHSYLLSSAGSDATCELHLSDQQLLPSPPFDS